GGGVIAAESRAEDVQAAVDHRRILFRGHPPPRAVAHLPYGRARPLAYQVARHSAAPAFCPTLAVPGAARGGDLRRGPFPVSRPPDVPHRPIPLAFPLYPSLDRDPGLDRRLAF